MTRGDLLKRLVLFLLVLIALLGVATCSDDDGGSCPGKICSSCAGSGDCDLTCTPPQVNFCGAFGYFKDPSLRCSFCAAPDYKP